MVLLTPSDLAASIFLDLGGNDNTRHNRARGLIDWMCSPWALRPWSFVFGEGLVKILDNRVEDVHEDTRENTLLAKCKPFLALDLHFLCSTPVPSTVSLSVATVGSTSKCPSSALPSAISACADENKGVSCSPRHHPLQTSTQSKTAALCGHGATPWLCGKSRTTKTPNSITFPHTSGHVASCFCTTSFRRSRLLVQCLRTTDA